MSKKISYTADHLEFILDNWIQDEDLCVKVTGHSKASIKLMLQNIGASYGLLSFSEGNPMYTQVADKYREANQVFGESMSKKSFCVRFGIITHK